tara:strand:+ start:4885 stop:5487 length:603 start_codon:yes stop_codon:yes gene_type:complete
MAIEDNMLSSEVFEKQSFEACHSILVPLKPGSIEDAKLIVEIRSRTKGSFLNVSSEDPLEQINFLQSYHFRNIFFDEIYFKVFDKAKNEFNGLVRITELKDGCDFNWQSFVCKPDCSPQLAIDVMLSVYQIGFEFFNKNLCGSFAVDQRAKHTKKLHKLFGMAEMVKEDIKYEWYEIRRSNYDKKKEFFQKLGYGLVDLL